MRFEGCGECVCDIGFLLNRNTFHHEIISQKNSLSQTPSGHCSTAVCNGILATQKLYISLHSIRNPATIPLSPPTENLQITSIQTDIVRLPKQKTIENTGKDIVPEIKTPRNYSEALYSTVVVLFLSVDCCTVIFTSRTQTTVIFAQA